MANTNVAMRIDETLKSQLQELMSNLGLDMTTFFTMAAKQAVREQSQVKGGPMRNDLMTLKEVCKETGVTRKIVQTYENYGLVKATTKNKYGYLLYDDAAVKKIKRIRLYQRFGYRLSEIAKLEYMTVDEQVMILKEKINNMYDNQSETAELIEMAEQLLENLRSH